MAAGSRYEVSTGEWASNPFEVLGIHARGSRDVPGGKAPLAHDGQPTRGWISGARGADSGPEHPNMEPDERSHAAVYQRGGVERPAPAMDERDPSPLEPAAAARSQGAS
jgi:hypothetical protein